MKRVAILQSSYIPWKGYFDVINFVDEFILYDDVQYTRRDWRNRNIIKTRNGPLWLTIPVVVKDKYHQKINETIVSDPAWAKKHWQSIVHAYKRAPHFNLYSDELEWLYSNCQNETNLSMINYLFINKICGFLKFRTKISWSTGYQTSATEKTERLVEICLAAKATNYLSGPSAQSYIDPAIFSNNGIDLEYIDYANYPSYPQLCGDFIHKVSILDLLFNTGNNASKYMLNMDCNEQ